VVKRNRKKEKENEKPLELEKDTRARGSCVSEGLRAVAALK
jgi:hypothetical protein